MAIYEPIEPAGSRRRLRLRSPVTLEPIGEIECANAQDVGQAIERARKAQPDWADLSFDERSRYMDKVSRLLLEKQEEVVELVIRETGKARAEAVSMEVFASLDCLVYYAKNTKKFLKMTKTRIHGVLGFAKRLRIVYKPRGVVGIITPWNAPFILAMNQAVQALMAGNAVIVKGSEVTPLSTT